MNRDQHEILITEPEASVSDDIFETSHINIADLVKKQAIADEYARRAKQRNHAEQRLRESIATQETGLNTGRS